MRAQFILLCLSETFSSVTCLGKINNFSYLKKMNFLIIFYETYRTGVEGLECNYR